MSQDATVTITESPTNVTISSGNETVAVQSSTTLNVVESVSELVNIAGVDSPVNTPLISVDLAGDPDLASTQYLFEDNAGVTANVQGFQVQNNDQTIQAIPPTWNGRAFASAGSVRESWQSQATAFPASRVIFGSTYGLGGGSSNARITAFSVFLDDANARGDLEPAKVFHTRGWGGPAVMLQGIEAGWQMTQAEKDALPPMTKQLQNTKYNQISVGTPLIAKSMVTCFNKAATAGVDGGTF